MTNEYLENTYGAHNYKPLPVELSHAKGAYVWDTQGQCYLDMNAAYSAVSHGHCHSELVKTLQQQSQQLNVVSRAFYTQQLGLFLQTACETFDQPKAIPMNTGAEAVETAVKAARKWAYEVKGVRDNQAEIIVCANNFHGRTTTLVGLSTETLTYQHFGPYTPGFTMIPFGDAEALREHITPNTAAFIVEPIQGEGGIIVPPNGYLQQCQQICQENNVLMIADEVQTGLGRTGKLLACQHEAIQPDGLILGKALGGGLLPVSLFMAREDVMDVFTPGTHGSTFGGNPLAAAVGRQAIHSLLQEQLTERSHRLGELFQQHLRAIDNPLIKEVRGRGLFIGVELTIEARPVCEKLMEAGMLCKDTKANTIRFAPPLSVEEADLTWAAQTLSSTLSELNVTN